MTFERVDSSIANRASAVVTQKPIKNAPMRRLERLASIRTERLNSLGGAKFRRCSRPPRQEAVQAKQREAEFNSLFMGSYLTPNRGDSGSYANF